MRSAAAMAALTCRRSLPDHGGIKPALRAIAGNRLPANGSSASRGAAELPSPLASNQWHINGSIGGPVQALVGGGLLMASSYHAGFTR